MQSEVLNSEMFQVTFIHRLNSCTCFIIVAIFVWILALAQCNIAPNLGPIYKETDWLSSFSNKREGHSCKKTTFKTTLDKLIWTLSTRYQEKNALPKEVCVFSLVLNPSVLHLFTGNCHK